MRKMFPFDVVIMVQHWIDRNGIGIIVHVALAIITGTIIMVLNLEAIGLYLETIGTASDDKVGITVIINFQCTVGAVSCFNTGGFYPYTSGLIHWQGKSYESLDTIAATLKYNKTRPHGTIKNSSKPQSKPKTCTLVMLYSILAVWINWEMKTAHFSISLAMIYFCQHAYNEIWKRVRKHTLAHTDKHNSKPHNLQFHLSDIL